MVIRYKSNGNSIFRYDQDGSLILRILDWSENSYLKYSLDLLSKGILIETRKRLVPIIEQFGSGVYL